MVETVLARMGVAQWGDDADTFDRTELNNSLANINARAAYDDGVTYAALPAVDLHQGRYAKVQAAASPYYTTYRRTDANTWDVVGGNTDPTVRYFRGAAPETRAWEVSSSTLAGPSSWMNHNGDAQLGGRVAVYDDNAIAGSALHVGSTAAAAPGATGRLYARTVSAGDRAIVASAHAGTASYLYSAISGGQDVWTVDSVGRMQARSTNAFGSAALAAGVPLASAALAGIVGSAARLYGHVDDNSSALQLYRGLADAVPIFDAAPNQIALGRAAWPGGVLDLRAPTITTVGAWTHTGSATISDDLTVGDNAVINNSLTVVDNIAAGGDINFDGGNSVRSGTTVELRTDVTKSAVAYRQSLRQPYVWQRDFAGLNIRPVVINTDVVFNQVVTLVEAGWLDLAVDIFMFADNGAAPYGSELSRGLFTVQLRSSDGSAALDSPTLIWPGTMMNINVSGVQGAGVLPMKQTFAPRLAAGDYQVRVTFQAVTPLFFTIYQLRYRVTPVVLQ